MKNQKENLLDKIGLIIILITIMLINIFIGSNIKQPIWIVQAIISFFAVIYIIIKKIQKYKNVIIKGKIDVAVLLLMISTVIPYILHTNVSLEGTINFILKYWAVFGFYILIRNIIVDNKKIKIVINTVICSSMIPIIFGFDKFTFNVFKPFLDFINAVDIEDIRMISTFGYANTFAVYLVLTISLAIAQYFNVTKKKCKVLYGLYVVLASITVILTQSKAVLALSALIILIFIIKGIKKKKISKKWIISGIIITIIFLIYVFVASKISKPLEITEETKNCIIRGVESNTDYDFELNINTETELTDDVYLIKIVEVTKYFSEKTLARENFSKFNGIKTISVKTSSEIDHIEIRIENKLNQKLTINELKVNGKSYIIEYKIIPEPVIRVFTTFNFKNSSVWQRADYWQDAMKIIKEHWLFGAGGNTWRMLYGQNQSYLYYAKEAHCYILELWMSFGLLGLISYIFILVITIKNVYKMLKKTQDNRDFMAILVGISIIVVHGLMDFDMSYLIIEMIFYMYIAILNKNDKVEFKKINILEIFIIVIMTIISIGNVLGFFADILTDETGMPSNKIAPWVARHEYNRVVYLENHKIQDENEIRYIEEYIENEPYQRQNIMYEIMTNKLIEKLDSQNIESHIKDIKYLVNTWKSVKRETKYDIIAIQERAEIMLNLAKSCKLKAKENANKEIENLSNEILELIKEEYSENVMIIIDYKKNRELESITKFKYQYYTKVYREAVELLEKQ